MMREKDVPVAQMILKAISDVEANRKALSAGVSSAGVRCNGISATWLSAHEGDFVAIARILHNRLDATEAHWRRRAAQIGLVLEVRS